MERKVELYISDCYNCPFLEAEDRYGYSYHYVCNKLDIITSEHDGSPETYKLVNEDLTKFFNEYCPLDKVE